MKFCEIFNKYLNLIGCSSKEVSNCAGISESVISRYKNGNRVPSTSNLEKISNALAILSNNKFTSRDIFIELNSTIESSNIDFEIVRCNLNKLVDTFSINASELAKYLNFDPSYLSRIRNGERIPANKEEFVNALASFIYKKYNTKEWNTTLLTLINSSDKISLELIREWIINNKSDTIKSIDNFLKKLDDFDLNDFIKVIKFDKLKVPTIPFYRVKSKNYYGISEMKKGELDFFKATVFSKSMDDIFMCSDMPMEDMAKDVDFGKKWMFAIAVSLKKGLHLNIIHNLDRPFNEMMLGLESWIPIYMTGQVSPYYLKEVKNSVYNHLNYVSGSAFLAGECIKGYHNRGKYYLSNNRTELDYYKEKANLLLKKASSLMDIYRSEDIDGYKKFLDDDSNTTGNRRRIFSYLPLFTISKNLLTEILINNNVNESDIDKILKYRQSEINNTKKILKNSRICDNIYKLTEEEFREEGAYLVLDNIFYDKKIKYTYQQYLEHLKCSIEYTKNNNYDINFIDDRVFKNITISMIEDKYVVLSKSFNPIIHFVIRHPKLVKAIEEFNPLVRDN